MDPGLVNEVLAQSRRFHALPEAKKRAITLDSNHRGYIGLGTSTDRTSEFATVTHPNQSTSFMMMGEQPASETYLSGPNQWPELAEFRVALEHYHRRMSGLAARIIGHFAEALGTELAEFFRPPTTWLRLLEYPPQPKGPQDGVWGSAPHRDYGAITLLTQDSVGGLEVLDTDSSWIAVEPVPGAFVMNTGGVMQRWSNGTLRSTPHRVINRSQESRYSVPFFYDPAMDATIAPLPSVTDRAVAKFEPTRFDDLVRAELVPSYDRRPIR